MSKNKPSKIAGAGAGIAKLVGGKTPAVQVRPKVLSAKEQKEMATELVKFAKEDKAKGPKASKEQIAAMEKELDLMSLPPEQSPVTVTRRFTFDAAHRVLGHNGKCQHLHGHRYVVELTVSAPQLNALGMVIDFAVLKSKFGEYLDDTYDHNIILHKDDPLLSLHGENATIKVITRGKSDRVATTTMVESDGIFTRPPVVLPDNPTAENLAVHLFKDAAGLLKEDGITVVAVRVYETENCWADYRPPEGSGGDGNGEPGDEDGDPTSGGDKDGDEEGGGGEEEDTEEDEGDGGDDEDEDDTEDEDGDGGDDEGDEDGEEEDEEGDGAAPTVEGPAKTEAPTTAPPKKIRRERI